MIRAVIVAAVLMLLPLPDVGRVSAQGGVDERARQQMLDQLKLASLRSLNVSLDLVGVPLEEVLRAITLASAIQFRYAPTVADLTAPCTVVLKDEPIESAIQQALGSTKLTWVATGYNTVFIYPDTPAEREKYAQSIREFTVARGDAQEIAMILNTKVLAERLTMEPPGARPVIATDKAHTILVRATAALMDWAARIIAAYDTAAQTTLPEEVGLDPQARRRQIEAQLAAADLDPRARVAPLTWTNSRLKDVLAAIARSAGVELQYTLGVRNLDAPCTATLPESSAEDALRRVLQANGLAFMATGPRSVLIYPDTPSNRKAHTPLVRIYGIVAADPSAVAEVLNRTSLIGPGGLRPLVLTVREPPMIIVRATPDLLGAVTILVAEHDKR
jgi:hypothetical protein